MSTWHAPAGDGGGRPRRRRTEFMRTVAARRLDGMDAWFEPDPPRAAPPRWKTFVMTAAVIPTLLTYNGSAIVIDIKGENFYTTARYRRETLGQNIYLFDPFNHCKEPVKADIVRARLDPFKFIFGDGHANEADCQAAAQMLSMKSKVASGRDEWAIYWESLATELLAGLIYVIYNHRSGSTVDVEGSPCTRWRCRAPAGHARCWSSCSSGSGAWCACSRCCAGRASSGRCGSASRCRRSGSES